MTEMTTEECEPDNGDYLANFQNRSMDWTAARVFAMKNLKIATRYPANFIIWGIFPLLWLAPFLLMMTAVGGGDSANFMAISGYNDFIAFSIIGWFVYMYVDASIWSIGNNFRWEQFSGTLEPLFMTPVPRISILLGAAFSDTIQTTMSAFVMMGLSIGLFGVSYTLTMIAPILMFLLTMMLALYGFGFMVAGLILVFKDPSVLTQLVDNVMFTISPVNYPLAALPTAARFASFLLPSTIAIIVIRQLAINGAIDLAQFILYYGSLLVIVLFFWAAGVACFRYAERWTKQRGHMGGF